MRKVALGSFLLFAVLAGLSCTDSGSDTPTAAPQSTALLTLDITAEVSVVAANTEIACFHRWTMLFDGDTARSTFCSGYAGFCYGCTSMVLRASPVVHSGTHTLTLRFDSGSARSGAKGRFRVAGRYTTRSHATGSTLGGSLTEREVLLAEGESTSYTLELGPH